MSLIASPPAPFDTNVVDKAAEWKYWMRSFLDFIDISEVTDKDLKIKLFRAHVGRPIVEFLSDQPDIAQLNTLEKLCQRVEDRYARSLNKFGERLKFRSVKLVNGESCL